MTELGIRLSLKLFKSFGLGISLIGIWLLGVSVIPAIGQIQDVESEDFILRFPTPVLRAIALKSPQWLKSEIEKGAVIDPPPGTIIDRSPLFLAISSRCLECLRVLVEHGANINLTGPIGETPLFFSLFSKEAKGYVENLLKAGADVDARVVGGTSVLMTAAEHSDIEVLEMLLRKKPQVNHANEKGLTPLMAASDNADVVKSLLREGARIEDTDASGETAVFYSIREKHLVKLKVLVQAGANLRIVNKTGSTPEDIAEQIAEPSIRNRVLEILHFQSKTMIRSENFATDTGN